MRTPPLHSTIVFPNLPFRGRRMSDQTFVMVASVSTAIAVVVAVVNDTIGGAVAGVVSVLPLLLIGGLVFPVMVAVAKRPQRGILLLAGLVPFYGLLIIVPGKPPFAEGWKEGLALYTLAWSFIATPKIAWVERRFPKVAQPMLAYLIVGLVSAFAIGGVSGLVGVKIDYFWMLICVAVWRTPLDERDRDRLVTILMIDAVATSLIGIAQQFIGHERLVSWGYVYNTNVRFTGSFLRSFSSLATPFNFAFFLTFVILIAIPQCLDEPRRSRNVAFLCCMPVVGLALALTFVRGAWIALAVGLSYLAVRRYKVLLLLAPIAFVALLLLPGGFSESALSNESLNDRQLGWAQNINKTVSAPLGNGIGTTGASGSKAVEVSRVNAFVYEPDNQYFKALYELGVFGLWFFVFMFIAIFLESRKTERVLVGVDHGLALGFSAHVLGAMAASTVSTWMEIFPNDLYLWMMLSILVTTAPRVLKVRGLASTRSRFATTAAGFKPMSVS